MTVLESAVEILMIVSESGVEYCVTVLQMSYLCLCLILH